MRFPVYFTIALIVFSLSAGAQEVAAPAAASSAKPAEIKLAQATSPKPAAAAAKEAPEATPAPKKRGFFGRIFGKKEKATPAPETTPAATPVPATPKPRPKARKQEATTPVAEQPAKAETETAPAKPSEKTENKAPEATTAPASATSKRSKKGAKAAETVTEDKKEAEKTPQQIALDKAIASGDEEAIEKAKYDEVKSRAVEDAKVKDLKAKADAAATEEEGKKALRAYNKALFQKMRALDGSIRDRVDRMETAVMKRLESGQ